jgi:hypothetical protein
MLRHHIVNVNWVTVSNLYEVTHKPRLEKSYSLNVKIFHLLGREKYWEGVASIGHAYTSEHMTSELFYMFRR